MISPAAEIINVGKRAGCKLLTQEEINSLLVSYGQTREAVVRLKGGDPFIFGRGGEEALALVEAGIPFDIVPGVSSGVAAPGLAGIPITHRGLATSVTFATAHCAGTEVLTLTNRSPNRGDW